MNRRQICLFSLLLSFLLPGCGLDVVKDVYADPVTEITMPTVDSAAEGMIFEFSTRQLADTTNMGHIYIYYKIYNKQSTCNSDQSYLTGQAADENRRASSANRMIEYGFRELHVDTSGNGGLGRDTQSFTLTNGNHVVSICLRAPGYDPLIKVDDVVAGVPCRTIDKNFNFFEQSDGSNKPLSDDEDIKNFSTNPDTNPEAYCVSLFAVFSTFDEVFEPLYSPIHYLGSIKITE